MKVNHSTLVYIVYYNMIKTRLLERIMYNIHNNNNNLIIYIQSPISNVYKHTSSVNCTLHGLYNLKQYDHNQILNELVHITLLHTLNICAE